MGPLVLLLVLLLLLLLLGLGSVVEVWSFVLSGLICW